MHTHEAVGTDRDKEQQLIEEFFIDCFGPIILKAAAQRVVSHVTQSLKHQLLFTSNVTYMKQERFKHLLI